MAESSATVEAPEREITRCAAAMRAGRSAKNGAHSAATPSLRIGRAHGVEVLGARLLHDAKPRAQGGVEQLDRRRHDLGHHPRALAAAEHDEAQRTARIRRGIGDGRRGDHVSAHRIAGEGHLAVPVRESRFVKRAKAGGDRGHARQPATCWRGP